MTRTLSTARKQFCVCWIVRRRCNIFRATSSIWLSSVIAMLDKYFTSIPEYIYSEIRRILVKRNLPVLNAFPAPTRTIARQFFSAFNCSKHVFNSLFKQIVTSWKISIQNGNSTRIILCSSHSISSVDSIPQVSHVLSVGLISMLHRLATMTSIERSIEPSDDLRQAIDRRQGKE